MAKTATLVAALLALLLVASTATAQTDPTDEGEVPTGPVVTDGPSSTTTSTTTTQAPSTCDQASAALTQGFAQKQQQTDDLLNSLTQQFWARFAERSQQFNAEYDAREAVFQTLIQQCSGTRQQSECDQLKARKEQFQPQTVDEFARILQQSDQRFQQLVQQFNQYKQSRIQENQQYQQWYQQIEEQLQRRTNEIETQISNQRQQVEEDYQRESQKEYFQQNPTAYEAQFQQRRDQIDQQYRDQTLQLATDIENQCSQVLGAVASFNARIVSGNQQLVDQYNSIQQDIDSQNLNRQNSVASQVADIQSQYS